jgi:hypothetical protein
MHHGLRDVADLADAFGLRLVGETSLPFWELSRPKQEAIWVAFGKCLGNALGNDAKVFSRRWLGRSGKSI